MSFAENIMDTLKNVQVHPSKVRVEINDKTSKVLFSASEEKYQHLMNGIAGGIIEAKKHKKHGKIKTNYKLKNKDGYSDKKPLTELDRDILSACIAEWLAGNKYTTPNIIFRALVGKVGERGIAPTPVMKELIMDRIRKLMFTEFSSDNIGESYTLLQYTNGDELKYIRSAILPCCIVQAKINGQVVDAIVFDRESPLLTIANLKSQVVRYDAALLDIPNQNNTPMNIALKNYVIRRVCEIKLHKQLTPTLTFDDIYQKCGIENASRQTKANARNIIVELMQHLADKHFIDSFSVIKNSKGNKIHSVTFTFSEPIQSEPEPTENSSENEELTGSSNSLTGYSNSLTGSSNSLTGSSNSLTFAPPKNATLARHHLDSKDTNKNGYTI